MKLFPRKKVVFFGLILLIITLSGFTWVYASQKLFSQKKGGDQIKPINENQNQNVADTDANPPAVANQTKDEVVKAEEAISQLQKVSNPNPIHKNITSTFFWVGEDASEDNGHISNSPSAWDELWISHFGGVDDPDKRNGYRPAKFTPQENPFYVALPYNDFDEKGNRKKEVFKLATWTVGRSWADGQSVLKNQWIKITKNGKTAYAQWEDVGPFGEDDKTYVFGNSQPQSKKNNRAGIDVSPAVKDYLGLSDIDKVDWQFVDASLVPEGAWKNIVTTSQINWK